MKPLYPTLLVFLILSLAIMPGFSQDTKSQKADTKTQTDVTKEESRSDGLVKIKSRPAHDFDFDIHIDEEALEANIERAIEHAMRDVEVTPDKLERLEIHFNPIEINLGDLDLDIDPIEINIPEIDIDIDPIEMDLDDLDIDIDIDMDHDFDHDFDWDNDNDNEEDLDEDSDEDTFMNKNKNKDELKNKSEIKDKSEKSDQKEKDKAKGLKKIN